MNSVHLSITWDLLPSIYQQCAVCYADFWEAYVGVILSKYHSAVGKETAKPVT